MAITSFDILSCDKIPTKSLCSTNSSKGGNSCRLLKMNFATDGIGSLPSTPNKSGKTKKNSKSPYLTGDRVQLLSRVTEKRLVHKKTTDFVSSFPLAVNIYKANSDEFKSSKKANKKVKKSVLTLPNDPAPVPQVCTVSDMNDSEYCDQTDEDRKQKAIKKRIPIQNTKQARVREKDFEFYDRDAKYCSQLNINLDCSSTDMMKNFNGDGKGVCNKKKTKPILNKPQNANNNMNDVWAVLRNINRFQFRPSPPMSEESIIPIKKKVQKRRGNRKDTRVIETCRTEEFAYISSYEVDDKTPRSFSPSSSIDRITVIDKQNEFSKICEEFEKRLLKTHSFLKDSNNTKNRIRKNKIQCRNAKNNVRALGNVAPKENKQLVPLKKKKNMNFKPSADQKNKSDPTNSSSGNRDSLIDTENLQTTDNSDILSHKTLDESVFPTSNSFIYSDHSGSSKAELQDKIKFAKEKTSMTKESGEKSCFQLKGISRVVSSKEQDINMNLVAPNRFNYLMRKPRLVTTMPSSCIMPKLTQTEIKKRLAHIKYPLVILGKDQISSNIQVPQDESPQFNGLDDHIWPFMVEWSEIRTLNKGDVSTKDPRRNSNTLNKKCNSYFSDSNSSKSRHQPNFEEATNRQLGFKDKKQASYGSATNKTKTETKRPTPCSEINDKLLQSTKKQKSIVQLKDKMLNFLYKKSSSRNVINESHQNDEDDAKSSRNVIAEFNKVDADFDYVTTEVGVRSVVEPNKLPKKRAVPSPLPAILTNKRALHYAYPWAKAKWASDFIENVIKKIRSGVYYTQDHSKEVNHKCQADLKEVSVQAGTVCDSSDSTQTTDSDINMAHDVTITSKQNNCLSIPGFKNTLPALEIKTLNKNQIAVKHCMTNIMLQFDISVPAKSDHSTTSLSKSSSLIPIEVTESHTKIYKCKTTILNAMLPAELCYILPRMMHTIMNSNLNSDLPTALCPGKTDSCLSTISELTRYETADTVSSLASLHMTPEVKHVLEGRFSNKITCVKNAFTRKVNLRASYNYDLVIELLPKLSLKDLSQLEVIPRVFELNNTKEGLSPFDDSYKQLSTDVTNIKIPTCTTMQVYTGRNKRLSAVFKPYDLLGMIEGILSNHNLLINLNLTTYFDMLKLQYDNKNIEINMSIKNDKGVEKNISVIVTKLKIDSLYNAFPKINNRKSYASSDNHTRRDNPIKCIEYTNSSLTNKPDNTGITQVTSIKNKKKGFYKLYRKCKSTTNIPSPEKCINTPLNKVTTLEDFFQILGSKKMLCSVFDGYAAKKILSSIIEMKNWITEINPSQALLILLLTNKKDTPNLVRFRPILLQGIAVNRITRATELDMEIEVIERENLNKFSQQYEGISYLPETVTNYDNLLEELYWIAKTTASDYQRPFDESSERLLKSLLEKRKKLNPSYLRVMARYVGLGLLKSPTKN